MSVAAADSKAAPSQSIAAADAKKLEVFFKQFDAAILPSARDIKCRLPLDTVALMESKAKTDTATFADFVKPTKGGKETTGIFFDVEGNSRSMADSVPTQLTAIVGTLDKFGVVAFTDDRLLEPVSCSADGDTARFLKKVIGKGSFDYVLEGHAVHPVVALKNFEALRYLYETKDASTQATASALYDSSFLDTLITKIRGGTSSVFTPMTEQRRAVINDHEYVSKVRNAMGLPDFAPSDTKLTLAAAEAMGYMDTHTGVDGAMQFYVRKWIAVHGELTMIHDPKDLNGPKIRGYDIEQLKKAGLYYIDIYSSEFRRLRFAEAYSDKDRLGIEAADARLVAKHNKSSVASQTLKAATAP